MKKQIQYLIFLVVICEISLSEVPRPRGVSLSRAPLYNPTKHFTCFDNSITIPFSLVNDDYCDCIDGSDEPGTAACANGVFHCTNAGHRPLNIPSSRVNDGICDCCDGSDEYVSEACGNNCKELGRSAREEAQKRAELVKIGKQMRHDLSEMGIKMKQEKKDKLLELQHQRTEAELVLKEKEEIKIDIELQENIALEEYRKVEEENRKIKEEAEAANNRAEALETFTKFDSNQDVMIDLNELQTRQSFDKDRNGEVSDDEARYFLNEKEAVNVDEFVEEAWPRIKPFLMMDSGLFKGPAGEGSVEEVPLGDRDEIAPEEEGHEDGEQEEIEEEEEEQEETQEETPQQQVQYDDETQQLIDQATQARNDFNEAERSLRSIQHDINNIEDYLKKDFGSDEAFAALEGKCFDYEDREYVYKLCPFDKAVQQAKSGSADTRLGTWSKWNGPEGNIFGSMLYDKGQSCWNGPQRLTTVNVNCGSENKLISVTEPNRCEYLFEFVTPAACFELSDEQHIDDVHDEL